MSTPKAIKQEWEEAVKRSTSTVEALRSRFQALSLQVDVNVGIPLSAGWPDAEGTAEVYWLGNQPNPCFCVVYDAESEKELGLSRALTGNPDPREMETVVLVLLAAPRLFVAALKEVARLTKAAEDAVSSAAEFFNTSSP
jgi:hypothetical protein